MDEFEYDGIMEPIGAREYFKISRTSHQSTKRALKQQPHLFKRAFS